MESTKTVDRMKIDDCVDCDRESDQNKSCERYNFIFPYPDIKYTHTAKGNSFNIHIRTIQPDDAEEVFKLIDKNRNHFRKWLGFVDFVNTIEDERRAIENFIRKRQFIQNICKKDDADEVLKIDLCSVIILNDKIVGTCSYNQIIKNSAGSINIGYLGYWLDEKWEGLGIITSAVEKMVEYGFDTAKLDHINISKWKMLKILKL